MKDYEFFLLNRRPLSHEDIASPQEEYSPRQSRLFRTLSFEGSMWLIDRLAAV
jgi:hypothetical protein